jgi:pyruvate dehydrogenase E2 component (dihydrolipoamide acetyltransferase)
MYVEDNMAEEIKIKVPDIGGATNVDVIDILVKPGDEVKKDTSLITLESDKASMDIPSPEAGEVKELLVKTGDKVSEGDVILILVSDVLSSNKGIEKSISPDNEVKTQPADSLPISEEKVISPQTTPSQSNQLMNVCIPDIGGASDVDVIEIMVNIGQAIVKDQSLITLEGDKATMDIPSPAAGVIEDIAVKVGDKVSQDSLILSLRTEEGPIIKAPQTRAAPEEPSQKAQPQNEKKPHTEITNASLPSSKDQEAIPAGPAVRRMAREFGINLAEVKGSGRKSRITKEDLQQYVKTKLSQKSSGDTFTLPPPLVVDFTKFGKIEIKPLNKIKRLTGLNVHRSWISVPHVTQFDEADITELEAFRKSEMEQAKELGYKLTILAFVTKVVSQALAAYPQFNASLDARGENLIYKHYFHIGIAVETLNGLVVPVIKDVETLSVGDIAREMTKLSTKAREKGLMPADMSGGCFTISSLGGLGGTAFTPIVNNPEVAILGLSRASMKPVYKNKKFVPRLILPLSLSYDHRVIDGAEAARFTGFIAETLGDIRRILL